MIIRTTKAAIKAYMVDRIRTPCEGAFPTLVGARAFRDRFSPLQAEDLPAAMVFAVEETNETLDVTEDRRHLKIQIEVQAAGEDADTQLDIISDQIVDLFRNDEYLGGSQNGLVEWCRYTRGQLFYDEKRHVDCIAWVLDFDVRYISETAPDPFVSNMADFRSADVTYAFAQGNPLPPSVIPEVGSEITIPQ